MFPCQPTADRLSPKVGGVVQGKERAQGKGQGRIVGVGCKQNGVGALQSTKGKRDEPEIRAR